MRHVSLLRSISHINSLYSPSNIHSIYINLENITYYLAQFTCLTMKVWFITGSSRGLGLAIAEAALNNGDSVIATARKPEQLASLVDKFGPDRVLPVALDVTNNDQVIQAVKTGHEKFGQIDVVINNAGYANTAAVEDMDINDFRSQVDANLFGVVYVSKAVIPILRQQKTGGHIFQVSSLGGRLGSPGLSAYQCSKWAVGGFSTVLSREVAPLGIKVTVLEPGGIRTDWAGSSMQVPQVSEPYQQTVGSFVEYLRKSSGSEESIPSKIAVIILKLLDETDPPLRLIIGPNAVEYARYAGEALAASDEKWRELSLSSV
jgi:NAD(P)-dependent dehydrogenase (short-subunit alcohol dehydrogenase family)